MSIKDEIAPYTDGNGLVAPNLVPAGTLRASDNGVLFTSEYYILLKLLGILSDSDIASYSGLMQKCVGADGYLHRAPNDLTQDAPDDYHGAYAAHTQLGIKPGFRLYWQLFRQPQLIAMALIATRNLLYRILAQPFVIYAALVILTSCINAPASDTDSRILSWCLIKGTTDSSWLCKLAARVWGKRLLATYPNGMQDVFTIYFGPNHPLTKYMVKV